MKYFFIFPLIWLNILLGNQLSYPIVSSFGQLINWVLLANITYIAFLNGFSKNITLLTSIFLTILFKLIYLIGYKEFNIVYLIFYSLIFIFFSKVYFDNAFELLKKQLSFFLLLSIPIMFLQIIGFPKFLHYFNTLYSIEISPNVYEIADYKTIPVLFNYFNIENWGYETDINQYLSMQVRPPGLLHSNAMQGPVLLIASIFSISSLFKRKFNYKDSFISLAIVLCGSKIGLYGYLFVLLYSMRIEKNTNFRKSMRYLILYLFIYLFIYYLIFPLPFYQNFSLSSLNGSFFYRLIDFLNLFGGSFLSTLTNNFSNISDMSDNYDLITKNNNNQIGLLSGIVYLFYASPFILILFFIFKRKYKKYFILSKFDLHEKSYLIKLSLIWIIIVLLATPLLGSAFYAIFTGVSLYPIFYKTSKHTF